MARVQLFRLSKADPADPCWSASAPVPDSILVMAQDATQARYRAAVRMWIPKDFPSPPNPWLRMDMVRVDEVTDSEQVPDIQIESSEQPRRGRPKSYWTLSKPPKAGRRPE